MGTEGEMRSSRTADPQYEGGSTRGTRGNQRLTTVVGQKRRELRKRIRGGYESSFYFDCTFYQQEVGLIYIRRRYILFGVVPVSNPARKDWRRPFGMKNDRSVGPGDGVRAAKSEGQIDEINRDVLNGNVTRYY